MSEGGGTDLFASQLIAQREVLRRHVRRTDARDGTSVLACRRCSTTEGDQVIIEPAVMPPQMEQLPDLAGYAKTASGAACHRVSFPKMPRDSAMGVRSRRLGVPTGVNLLVISAQR